MLEGMTDPLASLRPWMEGIGGLRQADRIRRGMWLHRTLPRPPIGTTPHTVVHHQGKLRLRFYAPAEGAPAGQTVVIVPSMINRASICDLEPDRSLVAALAAAGHRVYLVDWGVPGPEDAHHDVSYILLNLLERALDRAARHAGRAAPNGEVMLLGYCQGGTLSAMFTALRPDRVAALAVFNAPVAFADAGRFARFVGPDVFDPEAIDPDRLVDISVMEVAFKLLDPMGVSRKYMALDNAAADPRRLARALARERWLEENVPMPGAFAREFIDNAYQRDRLMDGTWEVSGERVDLSAIRCPVLICAANRDFISPKEAVLPLADAVGSERVRTEVLDCGHIGVVVGSFGPRVFYPLLDSWFREAATDSGNTEEPVR